MLDSTYIIYGFPFLVPAYAKQLMLSALLGFLIGVERAWIGKVASLRTFSTICAGSCLFSILSIEAAGGTHALPHDVTRVAAQIVTGVGFLGGGVIFRTSGKIEGITTGALIWITAALGMACGFNQISLALWTFGVGVIVKLFSVIFHRIISYFRLRRIQTMHANRQSNVEELGDNT